MSELRVMARRIARAFVRAAIRGEGAQASLCALALAFGASAALLANEAAAEEVRIVQVAASGNYSAAVDSKGGVWTWGGNNLGQLGNSTRTNRTTPGRVQDPFDPTGLLGDVEAVSANGQNLVLKKDGTVWAWGANGFGQCGDGTKGTDRLTPVQVIDPSDASGFLTGVVAVAAGSNFSLSLKKDGTVWAWGLNSEGALARDPTTTKESLTPIQVVGLSNVMAIAAGFNASYALKMDGTVWAWGRNNVGQLGNGTTGLPQTTPVQVIDFSGQPLTGVIAISTGLSHTLALKADGTVWAWGANPNGQLGEGTTSNRSSAFQVVGLTGVTGISAGSQFSLATMSDGTARGWGRNSNGQLGDGTVTRRLTPVQVIDQDHPGGFLRGVAFASAGGAHSLALKDDGGVRAWGAKGVGVLGDGSEFPFSPFPVQVVGLGGTGFLTGIAAVSAFGAVSMARTSAGTVAAWGNNGFGQLGDGTAIDSLTPVQVIDASGQPLTGVSVVSAGGVHALAIMTSGTARAWGLNAEGQLGDGSPVGTTFKHVQVASLSGVVAVSPSGQFSLAATFDGVTPNRSAWAWGQNSFGQLGDGTRTRRLTPVHVTDPTDPTGFLTNVISVAGGGTWSLALKGQGTVWGWGQNTFGQLGDGTKGTDRLTPVPVRDPTDPSGFLTNVTAIGAGGTWSLALKGDGTVWGWGQNSFGQLGNGTTTDSLTPVQVVGLGGVTAIDAGGGHGLALLSDATVRAWGSNASGQLGDGTRIDRLTPVQVVGLGGVTAIDAGGGHSLFLLSDTTVRACGFNGFGQLGDGSNPNALNPVRTIFPKR